MLNSIVWQRVTMKRESLVRLKRRNESCANIKSAFHAPKRLRLKRMVTTRPPMLRKYVPSFTMFPPSVTPPTLSTMVRTPTITTHRMMPPTRLPTKSLSMILSPPTYSQDGEIVVGGSKVYTAGGTAATGGQKIALTFFIVVTVEIAVYAVMLHSQLTTGGKADLSAQGGAMA